MKTVWILMTIAGMAFTAPQADAKGGNGKGCGGGCDSSQNANDSSTSERPLAACWPNASRCRDRLGL